MSYAFPLTIPVLTTERLIMREPRETDLEPLAAFFASPRAVHMSPADRRMSHLYIMAGIGQWALRGHGFYSVDTRDGVFIGRVGVIFNDGWPEPELAWHMFANGEGKGFACEAALAARQDYHRRISGEPLISMIAPDNARSIMLAERLGARFERSEPGLRKPYDVYRHPRPTRGLA
jgi:RimJ/RimL family protein N-acetyltransferase